jgi:hypothetical protein
MGRPPASITIETEDCRKTVELPKSRGVEFVSDVLEFPWGYVAQLQDPDGNRLQVREGRLARSRALSTMFRCREPARLRNTRFQRAKAWSCQKIAASVSSAVRVVLLSAPMVLTSRSRGTH